MQSVTSNAVAQAFYVKYIAKVSGNMPTAESQEVRINIPNIQSGEKIITLGARVVRSSSYEYDIYTCGHILVDPTNNQFIVYISGDMVPYIGGKEINILYAVFS